MKTIIQASNQHMKQKNESKINIKNTIMIIKTMECQNNHKNPYDYYDKDMCIRPMINMIAKT